MNKVTRWKRHVALAGIATWMILPDQFRVVVTKVLHRYIPLSLSYIYAWDPTFEGYFRI